jgi:hypothetical protein
VPFVLIREELHPRLRRSYLLYSQNREGAKSPAPALHWTNGIFMQTHWMKVPFRKSEALP